MKTLFAALASTLLAPAVLAAAAPDCPAPSRPLIEIVVTSWSPLSLDGAVGSGGSLICTGGPTVQVSTSRDAFVSPGGGLGDAMPLLPDYVVVVTGNVPGPRMASLGAALGAASVGSARDCRLATVGTVHAAARVTWHGRGTRRNTFTVTTDDIGLPACSAEVETLIQSIFTSLLEAGSGASARALVID